MVFHMVFLSGLFGDMVFDLINSNESVFSFSFYKTSTRILRVFYKLVRDYVEIFRWLVKMLNGALLSVRSLASELARGLV
jgi:hypothetical protein